MCVHVLKHACREDQRTTCWNQFSASTMWVQRIKLWLNHRYFYP